MNVLVVDDDPTTQRIMKMFLERSGYHPTIQADGVKGLEVALGSDAPAIILLDWMLPGMDGPAVCRKLREAKPKMRPYIIMLSAKQGKEEIAAGLDAGADDFVSKPFNVGEMQARLRVARRMVEHQRELIRQIEENEALIQRNSLLGELMTHRQGGNHGSSHNHHSGNLSPHLPVKRPTDFTDHEARYMLSVALLELRLALQAMTPRAKPPEFRITEHSAWSGLLLPRQHLWLDVVISGEYAAANALFERSLGRAPANEMETSGFMAEVARMAALGFSRTLRIRAGLVTQPLMSRALRLWTTVSPVPLPEHAKSYDVTIDGQVFRFSLASENCPKSTIAPDAVRQMDILAGPFPPPELSGVPMFNEGVVISSRFLEKIATHELAIQQGECVSVRRPTKLARFFNHA